MNRKSVILPLCVAAVLIGLIAVGVIVLYSGGSSAESRNPVSQSGSVLLNAVPSDAAALLCFSDLQKATSFLVEPQQMFSGIFARMASSPFKSFIADLQTGEQIRTSGVVLSFHHSGTMEPLMIVDGGHAVPDTSDGLSYILCAASRKGLETALSQISDRRILLVSTTGTLISSALRHIESRTCILDNAQFASAAASMPGSNVIFVSNIYAPRLVSGFFDSKFRPYSAFLKDYAEWTTFRIEAAGDNALTLRSGAVCGKGGAFFYNMLTSLKGGESRLGAMLPSLTTFAIGIVIPDRRQYEEAFRKYLDANNLLQKRQASCDALKADRGQAPSRWADDASVCEVAVVEWTSGEEQFRAVLVRGSASAKEDPEVRPYDRGGYAAVQFGSLFSAPGEAFCARMGEWTVSGSEAAVADFISAPRMEEPPFEGKDCPIVGYIAPVSIETARGGIVLKARMAESVTSATAAGALVECPKGPFKVRNSGTGKMNLFSQSSNLSLSLKEENGKSIWAVPFNQPLAGSVCEVDNYRNGKIQYLFAAGRKLYLIDRLGRFCSGFPVDLGKNVTLGPAVYDFSGSKIYSAVVLHADNTIEMYNLNGQKISSWQTVTCPSSILSLPELRTVGGQKYWVVRTTSGPLAFGFNGGEPLKGKAAKNVLDE